MTAILKRIEAVERAIKDRDAGMFIIHYKDGSARQIHPGEALKLSLNAADKIERFEELPGGKNEGILAGLANILLIPAEK